MGNTDVLGTFVAGTEQSTKYAQITHLSDEQFRRLTGVSRKVFTIMVQVVQEADAKKKARGGRKSKLSIEDRLLMTLEYLREYRTYFHIAHHYGLSEGTAYKTIRWVEETLVNDPHFALPGKKALCTSDVDYRVILIDASETPIERPKKNKSGITPARKSATR